MIWTNGDHEWSFPSSPEKRLFFGFLAAVGPERWLRAKYSLPGFVEIEAGDVVVDCGAFVGGFARAALESGATVTAVEPSATNRRHLARNTEGFRLQVEGLGLGAMNGVAVFKESSTGVDSSFAGSVDEGSVTATYELEIWTIDELCERRALKPTFLKIEAEGLETQVLEGMQHTRPAKVVVDASPEGGSDDRDRILDQLRALGYETRLDLNMIYGRLD
jgi:FkbM family methyltransferase